MAKAKSKNRKSKKSSKSRFTASTADKYELYQLSVQSPEPDVEFLARVYKKERSKPARHFREDFSGTGLLTAHWVKRGSKYTAEAFDIDPEPIEWGKTHVFAKIGKAATRAVLHQADVRAPSNVAPDVR
ncbi:MAG: class I SAM-dependent methyltransferase, partial [Gammaproteobacteria bacterium]|nr:class I SAM-dependent methyltransferase [Gammaproteobacteria bacterium]